MMIKSPIACLHWPYQGRELSGHLPPMGEMDNYPLHLFLFCEDTKEPQCLSVYLALVLPTGEWKIVIGRTEGRSI